MYIPDYIINETLPHGIIEYFNDEIRVYSYKVICEMCVIYTVARHYEICEESLQCTYSKETECQGSKCQCLTNTEYKEGLCVLRQVGMYDSSNVHIVVVMAVLENAAQRGAS
jgi:hypothetical protein